MKYSAFNQINNNQLAEPMFFGNPVNISRFDQQKHEMFERLTEKQLSFFWRPEEIDISKDRIDFNGLSDSEKHIFLSNLKYQCLVEETEVLTPEGWVLIKNLKKGQLVYIYNPITKLGYFEEPKAIIHKPHNGIVYNFKSNGKLKYRQMVTPDHRMYYHDTMDKSEFGVMNAEDLTFIEDVQTGIIGYPYPTIIESDIIDSSFSLFLLIDFLSTQSILVVKEINPVNTTIILPFTGLNKETKIGLLQFLNDYTSRLNEIYKEDIFNSVIDENQFTVKVDNKYFADLISDKPFGFIDSKEISDYICVQIVVYLMEFNSSLFNKKEGNFYFEDVSIVDLVQSWAVRGGFATKSKLNKLKIVDAIHTEDSPIVKTKEVYHGFVSCVSVSTNAFFIRYKGVTSVTGNCVLDSIQGRSPNVVLLPLASIPELETWIELWSAFEGAIHARSYTHIIRGIVDNPEVIFDDIMVNPNILKRAEGSSKYYDDLLEYTCLYNLVGWGLHTLNGKVYDINPKSMKKKLYLCLVSINVLEAIRFYVSFACSFGFGERKLMEGNASIIKLIARDEACVDAFTEVATPTGWKYISELTPEDKIAQYHPEYKTIDFVVPRKLIKNKSDILHYYSGKHIDQMVTTDHRMVYLNEDFVPTIQTSEEFIPTHKNHSLVSGYLHVDYNGISLSGMDKFLILFHLFGEIEKVESGIVHVLLNIPNNEIIDNVIYILNENVCLSHYKLADSKVTQYYVQVAEEKLAGIDPSKLSSWINLTNKDFIWCNKFINELHYWIPHKTKSSNDKHLYYKSRDIENVSMVQLIGSLCGMHSVIETVKNKVKSDWVTFYKVTLYPQVINKRNINVNKTETILTNEKEVYCVSVPTGAFLMRRNGKVSVTGNCHMNGTQFMINLMKSGKDDPETKEICLECESEVINMFKEACEQEMEWADYLFKDGSMIGLNATILKDYIRYITNVRMGAIGLNPLFPEFMNNPIPWINNWLSSDNVQVAPQETEITSYLVGQVTSDLDEVEFDDFDL